MNVSDKILILRGSFQFPGCMYGYFGSSFNHAGVNEYFQGYLGCSQVCLL